MNPDSILNFLARRISEQEDQAATDEILEHANHAIRDAAAKRSVMRAYEWAVEDAKRHPTPGNLMVQHALAGVMRSLAFIYNNHPEWDNTWGP